MMLAAFGCELHYDVTMRTTIDLPDDLHQIASSIAREHGFTLSEAVARLMRLGIGDRGGAQPDFSPRTGLRLLHIDRIITHEDVRALEDDE